MQAFIPREDARGFIMPNFIFENKELNCGAKLLFSALCDYARNKSFCFPSKKRLARQLNTSLNTVKAWIKQLMSLGFVKIQLLAGRETFYLFYPKNISNEVSKIDTPQNITSNYYETSKERVSISDSGVSKIDTEVKVNNLNKLIPPISPKDSENNFNEKQGSVFISFEDFWNIYPKKENREKAKKAFFFSRKNNKLPSIKIFQRAVEYFLNDQKWQKEDGRFIPQLHNFLNDLRWKEYDESKVEDAEKQKIQSVISASYTSAYFEEQRKEKIKEGEEKRLQEEKDRQELELIDKDWKIFSENFKSDKKTNLIFARRFYIALYKEKQLPSVTIKQNCTALEFIQPFYEKFIITRSS